MAIKGLVRVVKTARQKAASAKNLAKARLARRRTHLAARSNAEKSFDRTFNSMIVGGAGLAAAGNYQISKANKEAKRARDDRARHQDYDNKVFFARRAVKSDIAKNKVRDYKGPLPSAPSSLYNPRKYY